MSQPKLEVAVGATFPVDRFLKAFGLEGSQRITYLSLTASADNFVTLRLERDVKPEELDALLEEFRDTDINIQTVSAMLRKD